MTLTLDIHINIDTWHKKCYVVSY